VHKFIKIAPEITPIINKAAKKGDEELKKKTIFLQKAFNFAYKELVDFSLKNLTIIHEFLQKLKDLSIEGKMGKNLKELLKENKEITLINLDVFRIENYEKLVVSTLLNEYMLISTLNISNVKEMIKLFKKS